jgi:hypothetical protein
MKLITDKTVTSTRHFSKIRARKDEEKEIYYLAQPITTKEKGVSLGIDDLRPLCDV